MFLAFLNTRLHIIEVLLFVCVERKLTHINIRVIEHVTRKNCTVKSLQYLVEKKFINIRDSNFIILQTIFISKEVSLSFGRQG